MTHEVIRYSIRHFYVAKLSLGYFVQELPKAGRALVACGELLLVLNIKMETDTIADLQDTEFRDLYNVLNPNSPHAESLPGLLKYRVGTCYKYP